MFLPFRRANSVYYLLACSTLSSAALAQGAFDWVELEVEGSQWPVAPEASAPFEVLEAGYVTDPFGTDADVLALRGGQLVLHYRFAGFDAILPVAGGVTGAALAADALPGATTDAVLVVDAAGLAVHRHDGQAPGSFLVAPTGLSGWADASDLWLEGTTLYATAASGTAILRASWQNGVASALPSVPLDEVALEFRPVDWDGDGTDELFVRTRSFVQVLSVTLPGAPILSLPSLSQGDRITVSRGQRGDGDRAIWYAGDGQGSSTLLSGNAAGWDAPLPLGAAAFDSLTAVSFDWHDGLAPYGEDLVLGDSGRGTLWLLRRSQQSTGPKFFVDTGHPTYFDPTHPGVDETLPIRCCVFDVDGDGDRDTLFGLAAADVVVMAEHPAIDRHAALPYLAGGGFDTSKGGQWVWTSSFVDLAPPAATHFQVEIWPEASLGAGREEVGSGSWLVDLADGWFAILLDATNLTDLSVLEIHIQPVRMDASGTQMLATYPAAVGFWSPDASTMAQISLLPEVLPYGTFCPGCEGGDPLQGSGIILGGQGANHAGQPPWQ